MANEPSKPQTQAAQVGPNDQGSVEKSAAAKEPVAKPTAPTKKPLTADQKLEVYSREVATVARKMHGNDPRMYDRLSGNVYVLQETHKGLVASFVSAGTTELFAIPLTYGVAGFTAAQGTKLLEGWAAVGEAIKAERAK